MNYTVYRHISPSGKVYVGITKRKPVERELNIKVTHITACCNGRRKTAGGYIWKKPTNSK